MRYSLTLSLLCFLTVGLFAQNNTWTLERCVQYAADNNLQIKQLENQVEFSKLTLQGNKLSRLPNINGSAGAGVQLGRTIDPTTNEFVQQNIGFNSYSLSAGVTLFNGNRINNSIRQGKLDVQAAELEARDMANNIGLNVANSYLTILLLREQLANARAQLQLTDDQLEQTDAAINAGSMPESQRWDLVAQQAANQRSIVDLENQLTTSLVSLQLLLELDPSEDFNVITPDLEVSQRDLTEAYTFEEVYLTASTTQPVLKAAELRRSSAEIGKDIARAGFYPTVSLFGSLSTNSSSVARTAEFTGETELGSEVPVVVGGIPTTIASFNPIVNFSDQPYFDQLNQNFGQSISLSVNIPIYSQGRNKIAVQQAEISRLNTDIQYQQAVNTLQNNVQLALTDLRGARQSYEAAQVSLDAAQQAYEVAKRRFDLGASNNLELFTATNRLDQARIELTRSKFQLLFNQQVIQFYLGNRLTLE